MWWKVGKNIYLCNRFLLIDVRMRFLGNIEAKTDAKGRAFLPAIFRKVLQASGEENLVLRKDVFQKCLVLYPESVWNARLDMLKTSFALGSRLISRCSVNLCQKPKSLISMVMEDSSSQNDCRR